MPDETAPEIAQAAAAPLAAHIQHCDMVCPQRATCPIRVSFAHVARGHTLASDAYPAELFPDVDQALQGVEPFLDLMQEARDACAREKHAAHLAREQEEAREEARVAPLVARVVGEQVEPRLGKIELLLQQLLAQAASLPEPEPPALVQAEEVAGEKTERVDDETARALIAEYRARYPHDDAEAVRRLFHETGVGFLQVARLTGWSKSTLSSWRNTPRQARSGLHNAASSNGERGAP